MKITVVEDEYNVQTFPESISTIEVGIPGIQGPSGASTYIHKQQVPASEWLIEHGLGKYPSVIIVDSTQRQIFSEVEYIDENALKILFSSQFAGKAFLN